MISADSKSRITPDLPDISLPKGWTDYAVLAVLHTIALARIVMLNMVKMSEGKECGFLCLRLENDRLRSEIALLQREIAVKDARFARLSPKTRPHYTPTERFEILTIRAIRGLTNEQTAKRFQVAAQTIDNWLRMTNTRSGNTQIPERINRYPDFVRYIVQQFKSFCPMLGRCKIADILCRAGLHLSASTVKRIINEPPVKPVSTEPVPDKPKSPIIQSQYPNHIWSVDLTVVPTANGLWSPWKPNAVNQVSPYAWYVLVVIDHYSRRVMGFNVFEQNPTANQVAAALNSICSENKTKPKYLVSDRGSQFTSREFRLWCKEQNIKQRFGAVGKHGSIAVTERGIQTYKTGCTERILVPIAKREMIQETHLFFDWYNEHRPHMRLKGKTPNEVYFNRSAANAAPRIETRSLAKAETPCASPRTKIADEIGAKVKVRLEFLEGRRHLPIIHVVRI